MMAVFLILVYALADRFAGGGWPKLDDKLPGRGAFWGALVGAGIGWLTLGVFGAVAGLAWLIWRTPAWAIFGGSMAPRTVPKLLGTVARHAIVIPLLALAAYWGGYDPLIAAVLAGVFAIGATALAVYLAFEVSVAEAKGVSLGSQNTHVELARGALFGSIVGLIAVFG